MPRRRDPRALPSGDRDRDLAEEVLHLHALWRQGPPAPAPAPNPPCDTGGSRATRRCAARRKRRRLEDLGKPRDDEDPDWPLAPSPRASSPATWTAAAAASSEQPRPPPRPSSPGSLAQRAALRAAAEFFAGHAEGNDDEEEEEEGSESEGEDGGRGVDEAAEGFFLGLFERDTALRRCYERGRLNGEFMCMACVGRKRRKGRARRFRGCEGLVQHARAATRCGRPRAHRALAAALCRVLAWDIERLPSIVIDPRGTLGQALATRQAKEGDETRKKNGSLNDGNATKVNGSLDDGNATKEDGSLSNVNNEQVHVLESNEELFEKETIKDVNSSSSKDASKNGEHCEAVQEEEAATESAEDIVDTC